MVLEEILIHAKNLNYLGKPPVQDHILNAKGFIQTINELERNDKIDKNLLRFVTIRVKKFDLKTEYFNKDKKTEYYNKDKKTEYFNKDKNKQEKSN